MQRFCHVNSGDSYGRVPLTRADGGCHSEDADASASFAEHYHQRYLPLSPGLRAYLLAVAAEDGFLPEGDLDPAAWESAVRDCAMLQWDGTRYVIAPCFRRFLLSLRSLPGQPLGGDATHGDLTLYEAALRVLVRQGDAKGYAAVSYACGVAALGLGEHAAARRHLLAVLCADPAGVTADAFHALGHLMELLLPWGRTAEAEQLCQYALAHWDIVVDKREALVAWVAAVQLYRGDFLRCERILLSSPATQQGDTQAVAALLSAMRGQSPSLDTDGCTPFVAELMENAAGLLSLPISLRAGSAARHFTADSAWEAHLAVEQAVKQPHNSFLWDAAIHKAAAAHPYAQAQALLRAALQALEQGHQEQAARYAQECLEMAEQAGFQYYARMADGVLCAYASSSKSVERYRAYCQAQSPRVPSRLLAVQSTPAAGSAQAIPFALFSSQNPSEEGIVQVRCFDGFDLIGPSSGGQPLRFRTRKAQELLAYLVHNAGTMIDREQIMTELWPDKSPQQARTLLHTTLYNLRKALASIGLTEWVAHDKHAYGLRLTDVHCDAVRLDQCLNELAALSDDALRDHAASLSLYTGPYMRSIDGSWHLTRQARFENQVAAAHKRLAEYLQRIGEYRESLKHYQQIVLIDPLNEPMQMQLIACHVQLGNRTAAIQQYRTLCNLLKEELDAEPDLVTLQYAKRLLGGDPLAGYAS